MRTLQTVSCVVLLLAIATRNAPQSVPSAELSATEMMPKCKIGKDGARMVLIPAGEFQMGTDTAEIPQLVQWAKEWAPSAKASWFEDETPRHKVYLDDFYMDVYEVTNAQYRRFVQATGHKEPEGFKIVRIEGGELILQYGFKPWSDKNFNDDNQPVVCVTWEDAKAYCEWAGKRLPTEAEWEKAARGGLAGKRYVWDDDSTTPKGAGNFADETAKKTFPDLVIIKGYDDGYTYPAPVGSFTPNGYGLYDMAGNIWEWCADWYDDDYYARSPKEKPEGPDSGGFRVLRGGGWDSNLYSLRVAFRGHYPTTARTIIGFRCVAQD